MGTIAKVGHVPRNVSQIIIDRSTAFAAESTIPYDRLADEYAADTRNMPSVRDMASAVRPFSRCSSRECRSDRSPGHRLLSPILLIHFPNDDFYSTRSPVRIITGDLLIVSGIKCPTLER